MSYTPLSKTVIQPAIGDFPPINGIVKIHIKQLLTDGTVLSDSIANHPLGHTIDLTNTHVLSSLIDELMSMVPGEISQFLCKHDQMMAGLFSVDLPLDQDLILEVEMLDWFGQDISPNLDKSLLKIIVDEGSSKNHPCWTGKCTIILSSTETPQEQEILFRVGDGPSYNVPHHVELCVLTMRRNETCRLETRQTTYTIRLVAFEKERMLYKLDVLEIAKLAEELKIRGNNAYKANKLRLAELYYERCITYIDSIVKSDHNEEVAALVRDCNLNLAQVYLKRSNYSRAISHATTVLWTFPGNVKALYRRAMAYEEHGMYEEATKDLAAVLDVDSGNAAARALLAKVKSGKLERSEEEKQKMRTVFKKIDTENAATAEAAEPIKSVWDEAKETCPTELATEEAYKVYADQIAEEQRIRKEEAAARQAEYLAANPPKKKKKKKKKKKPVENQVTIAETVEVKVDKQEEPVLVEPDADMKYEVTAEKTFINKSAPETDFFTPGNTENGLNGAEAVSKDETDAKGGIDVNGSTIDVKDDIDVKDKVALDELNEKIKETVIL